MGEGGGFRVFGVFWVCVVLHISIVLRACITGPEMMSGARAHCARMPVYLIVAPLLFGMWICLFGLRLRECSAIFCICIA